MESLNGERSSKKDKLTAAAVDCFHRSGYAKVTLGQVAESANVPLGNVYYYFRTKSALAEAAVRTWTERVEAIFGELAIIPTPRRRLLGYLRRAELARGIYTDFGCPLANLSRDLLASGEPELANMAGRIYAGLYRWSEDQFLQLGQSPGMARASSRFLVAGMQGGILMAHANRDPGLIQAQVRQLRQWLVRTTRRVL